MKSFRSDLEVEDLFAPISLGAFLNQYWLRRYWHQSGTANRFSSILSSNNIEFLAASLVAHAGWISLVRDGAELNIAALKASNGFISAGKLRQARANGFTVLLSSLQRRCPAISNLCRSLEGALIGEGMTLSRPVVANAYATPTQARGFKPHYDDHEVVVLQLEGRKRWRVYKPIVENPLDRLVETLPTERLGPPVTELELAPGDVLYLPRGYPHEASSADEPTLHLTLAIHTHTWLDLMVALMRRDPKLRAALPPQAGTSKQQADAWSEAMKKRLARLDASPDAAASVLSNFRDAFMAGIEPALQATSTMEYSPAPLTLGTHAASAPGYFFQFDDKGDEAYLLYPGGRYSGPSNFGAAFKHIASHPTFIVGDLPGLKDDIKLRVVSDLVAQGCLVIVPAAD